MILWSAPETMNCSINQKNYEKLIDEAADEISNFVEKVNLEDLPK